MPDSLLQEGLLWRHDLKKEDNIKNKDYLKNEDNLNFLATCYKKSDSYDPEEMCFVESKNSYYDPSFVISDLLSVRGSRDFIIVNCTEIEEVVLSRIDRT